jgi:hypothetical protein
VTFSVGAYDELHRNWFSPQFLHIGHHEAPACTWHRDSRKVTRTWRENGRVHVWMLTDEYDEYGYRLGVWPD